MLHRLPPAPTAAGPKPAAVGGARRLTIASAGFRQPLFVGKGSDIGLAPLSAPAQQSSAPARAPAPPSTVCAAAAAVDAAASALPWQAAMSEIKKRRDIQTIMIIGAGPIVIGQVPPGLRSGVLSCLRWWSTTPLSAHLPHVCVPPPPVGGR